MLTLVEGGTRGLLSARPASKMVHMSWGFPRGDVASHLLSRGIKEKERATGDGFNRLVHHPPPGTSPSPSSQWVLRGPAERHCPVLQIGARTPQQEGPARGSTDGP